MTTLNPRINVTIPQEIANFLEKKAEKNNTSMSKVALELIMDAMERDEDIYYSRIADEREKTTQKWYSHEEAWK